MKVIYEDVDPKPTTPHNAYPCDVTSPGPYQLLGMAQSQQASTPAAEDGEGTRWRPARP